MKKFLLVALMTASSAFAMAECGPLQHCTVDGVSPKPLLREGPLEISTLSDFVDAQMQEQYVNEGFAGAVVAVVKDGQTWLKEYGSADIREHRRIDPNTTPFRLASVSKLITATAVMQLVQSNKIALKDDVNKHLSAFKLPETFSSPITLWNLMTHTSGLETTMLGYQAAIGPEGPGALEQTLASHLPKRMVPPLTDAALFGGHIYANYNAALAGYIVSQVTGQPFEDYVQDHIFAPLGMTHSSFLEPVPVEKGYVPTSYSFNDDGKLVPEPFEFMHRIGPASSMSASAGDMAKLMIEHLELERGHASPGSILDVEHAQLMHRRQYSPNRYLNGSALGFAERYVSGRRVLAHSGGLLSVSADLYLMPEENLGLFIAYNTSGFNGEALFYAVMNKFFPADMPVRIPSDGAANRAQQYAGTYMYAHRFATWEKYLNLASMKVAVTEGGGLEVPPYARPNDPSEEFIEVPGHCGLFHRESPDTMIAFEEHDGRMYLLGEGAAWPMMRARFYETAGFTEATGNVLLTAFTFLIPLVIACITATRHADNFARSHLPACVAIGVLAALGIAIMLCLDRVVETPLSSKLVAIPDALKITAKLSVAVAVITAMYLGHVLQRWAVRGVSAPTLLAYFAIAVPFIVFVLWLKFWNLFGWHVA